MIPTKPGYYWWSWDNKDWYIVKVWGITINKLEIGCLVEDLGCFRTVEEQKGFWGPKIEQYTGEK
jgi:hypothetical protein